jgi:type I restriction enzyme R subunit
LIRQLEEKLVDNAALQASVRVNAPDNARLTFDHVVSDHLQELLESNFRFYKLVTDDAEFAKSLFDWLFERYYRQVKPEPAADAG